jgi:hypothetical protein
MPNMTIKNVSGRPVFLTDLYITLQPQKSITVYRPESDIERMTNLQKFRNAGTITITLVFTPSEQQSTINSPLQAVATISVLPTLAESDGMLVFVQEGYAYWAFVLNGAALVIDHVLVEATAAGGNTRWVREDAYKQLAFGSQTNWYIDPVSVVVVDDCSAVFALHGFTGGWRRFFLMSLSTSCLCFSSRFSTGFAAFLMA